MFKKSLISSIFAAAALSFTGVAMANSGGMSFSNANSAYNNTSGVYVSGQLGWGRLNVDSSYPVSNKNGLAGRVAVGYNFNENFGLEMGAAKYRNIEAKVGGTSLTFKNHSFDLLGKGVLPVGDQFALFGKVGLAYVATSISQADNIGYYRITPKVEIGGEYLFTDNLGVNVSVSRIFKRGNADQSRYVPNIDMAAVGLTYYVG